MYISLDFLQYITKYVIFCLMNWSGDLKSARKKVALTQADAAARLGVSQPYLSHLERGLRRLTPRLARAVAKLYGLPATALPVPETLPDRTDSERLARELAALGYPGYAHLTPRQSVNPALVVFEALSGNNVDARVTEALPWVLLRYPDLDWDWLVEKVKLRNLQNKLGFLVGVAQDLAKRREGSSTMVAQLAKALGELEQARLVAETTLGREAMPSAERKWLRKNRTLQATHWNVLSTLSADRLPYAA
jgi:transcriptional regulator with XRE-family HTH domain